jgi:hypothetical protein
LPETDVALVLGNATQGSDVEGAELELATSVHAGSALPLVGGFQAGSRFLTVGRSAMEKNLPDRNCASTGGTPGLERDVQRP